MKLSRYADLCAPDVVLRSHAAVVDLMMPTTTNARTTTKRTDVPNQNGFTVETVRAWRRVGPVPSRSLGTVPVRSCHPGAIERHWTREIVRDAMSTWRSRYGLFGTWVAARAAAPGAA